MRPGHAFLSLSLTSLCQAIPDLLSLPQTAGLRPCEAGSWSSQGSAGCWAYHPGSQAGSAAQETLRRGLVSRARLGPRKRRPIRVSLAAHPTVLPAPLGTLLRLAPLAFSCPPHPQALFWCVCPFPEPRPLLSFSLQGCSSCDLPGSGRRAPPCLPLLRALPLLFLFLVGPASPIVVPRKGLSRWARGGGTRAKKKAGPEAPASPDPRLTEGWQGPRCQRHF